MWCTRWFVPLMILPLPTTPPYFLMIFVCSLSLHSRPCFYCMVILTILFSSSCYWEPLPLTTPLSTPIPITVKDALVPWSFSLNSSVPDYDQRKGLSYILSVSPEQQDSDSVPIRNPAEAGRVEDRSTSESVNLNGVRPVTVTTFATTFGAYLLHNLSHTYPDAVREVEIVLADEESPWWSSILGRAVSALAAAVVDKEKTGAEADEAEATNGTTTQTSEKPRFTLPSTIPVVERCWCGLNSASSSLSSSFARLPQLNNTSTPTNVINNTSTTGPITFLPPPSITSSNSIFEPTSVEAWERATLERALRDVARKYVEVVKEVRLKHEREMTLDNEGKDGGMTSLTQSTSTTDSPVNTTTSSQDSQTGSASQPTTGRTMRSSPFFRTWSSLSSFKFKLVPPSSRSTSTPPMSESTQETPQKPGESTSPVPPSSQSRPQSTPSRKYDPTRPGRYAYTTSYATTPESGDAATPTVSVVDNALKSWKGLPWFRKEYDFLPYGVDLIIDFKWARR